MTKRKMEKEMGEVKKRVLEEVEKKVKYDKEEETRKRDRQIEEL